MNRDDFMASINKHLPLPHEPTVHHVSHRDPFLGSIVHGYRPVCSCNWRGKLTSDERAAQREAMWHGRTT